MNESRVKELCALALEEQCAWREGDSATRRVAYDRFRECVSVIAKESGKSYDDVLWAAVEDWLREKFCCVPNI